MVLLGVDVRRAGLHVLNALEGNHIKKFFFKGYTAEGRRMFEMPPEEGRRGIEILTRCSRRIRRRLKVGDQSATPHSSSSSPYPTSSAHPTPEETIHSCYLSLIASRCKSATAFYITKLLKKFYNNLEFNCYLFQ